MTNREQLKQYLAEYQLTRQQLADILEIPLATLNSYLLPDTSKASRKPPKLLAKWAEFKLSTMEKP